MASKLIQDTVGAVTQSLVEERDNEINLALSRKFPGVPVTKIPRHRVARTINQNGVEIWHVDGAPVLEFYPIKSSVSNDGKLTASQPFRRLYEERGNGE